MNYVLNLYAKLSTQVVEDGNGTLISCHNPSHSLTMVQELLHHDWPLKTPTVLQFKPFYSKLKKKKKYILVVSKSARDPLNSRQRATV